LTLTVWGEVETTDTNGLLHGTTERFPDAVFLRPTSLTEPDPALRQFALDCVAGAGDDHIARLHALMRSVHDAMIFDTEATEVDATAAKAFALGRGVCQDLTHIFIAAARLLGYPARYVSGHLAHADGRELEASHAWAEAKAPGLGWIGFDPTNDICPTDAYLRVAVGLDYLGAAPVRGSRYGGGAEVLDVRLKAADAMTQGQA
jgi:transglutaminase-like putative cysteine protease